MKLRHDLSVLDGRDRLLLMRLACALAEYEQRATDPKDYELAGRLLPSRGGPLHKKQGEYLGPDITSNCMTNLVTDIELNEALHHALLRAMERLAPIGSQRTIPVNVVADALVELLANLLAVTLSVTEEDLDGLANRFYEKLEQAIKLRQGSLARH
jgi:hypothetical protein